VQEALASGLPVVCGEESLAADPALEAFVRGAPVYMGDDDRTARGFLKAIGKSLASDAHSTYKSERRRAFAISRYSWDRTAQRYMEIISRLSSRIAINAEQNEPGAEREYQ
jgi:glycosyltransferase involved in cell wall biosynthesis